MDGRASSILFYFIIQRLTEALHKPLDIIIIKYLLAAKSLLQSLNLVPLQFLEQGTDLGITDTFKKKKKKQKYLKKLVNESSFRPV